MSAEDAERHSSCVCVLVKLQDTVHQNPENGGCLQLKKLSSLKELGIS